MSAHPVPPEGRLAIVTDEDRMRWTQIVFSTRALDLRTAPAIEPRSRGVLDTRLRGDDAFA